MKTKLSATANLATVSLISAVVLLIGSLIEGQSIIIPDSRSLAILCLYGILSQVVAWILISRALPHVKASTAGLILLLQPALSFLWDIFLFNRNVSLVSGVGVMITLAGIYLGAVYKKGNRI